MTELQQQQQLTQKENELLLLISQKQTCVSQIAADALKFATDSNAAAGTRARNGLQEIKTIAQSIRNIITEIKNIRKELKS